MMTEMRSEPLHSFTDHGWQVCTAAFSPCSTYLATGSWDKSVIVYNVADLKPIFRLSLSHALPVTCLRWLNRDIITTSADRTAALWDTSTGQCTRKFSGHSGWVMSCDVTDSNITTTSWDNTLALWDVNHTAPVRIMSGHVAGVWSCAGLKHSQVIASASEDCTLRLWDRKTGTSFATLAGGHTDSILSVCWPRNEYVLASSSTDCNILLWDTRTCKTLARIESHTDSVKQLLTLPHQPGVIASVGDTSLKIWDTQDSNNVRLLGARTFTSDLDCVAISDDMLTHVCGAVNATAYMSLFVGVDDTLHDKLSSRYKTSLDRLREEADYAQCGTFSTTTHPTKRTQIPPQYIPRHDNVTSPIAMSPTGKRESSSCSDSGVDVGNSVYSEALF